MKGALLRFYLQEGRRQEHLPLYEWLLQHARRMGIGGGSVFRSIAGFGHHGVLHEERFFEIAGELPVAVEFVLTDADADALLASLRAAGIGVFFSRIPAEYGTTDGTT
jgi:uncharacterized protein